MHDNKRNKNVKITEENFKNVFFILLTPVRNGNIMNMKLTPNNKRIQGEYEKYYFFSAINALNKGRQASKKPL